MGRSPPEKPSKPSPAPLNVSNPKLYLRIKARIRARLKPNQRWGAYHSGMLVQQYKRAGGTYREARPCAAAGTATWRGGTGRSGWTCARGPRARRAGAAARPRDPSPTAVPR